jgi:hypothetical protein
MILNGRFVGFIWDKSIGYTGVAEVEGTPDFPIRVMLVKGRPAVLTIDALITVSWPDANILSVRSPVKPQKRANWFSALKYMLSK